MQSVTILLPMHTRIFPACATPRWRGHRHEAAGRRRAQRLEPAAGARQLRVGQGTGRRPGVAQPSAGFDAAVKELLEPATYARMRANAAAQSNRAVFEIPDMLQRI